MAIIKKSRRTTATGCLYLFKNGEPETQPTFPRSTYLTTCPHCKRIIMTHVVTKVSEFQKAVACAMCLFGSCCCSCIPYLMNSLKTIYHYCPKCKRLIGIA